MFFQNPQYRASRQLLITRIAAVGTSFSPLPCQAWHGYTVTSAHRVEVEVGADGLASAPLSGAAAAAPPAGAPGGGCLCDFPICVIVIVTTYVLVTFRIERVCTVQHVMGPRLTSLTRDNLARRAAIATSTAKGKFIWFTILLPCSRRYRQ
jgi:hypothetical protein